MVSSEGTAELLKKAEYSEISTRNRFRKASSRKNYLKKNIPENLTFLDGV